MRPTPRRLIKTAIILAALAPVLALAGVYFLHDIDPPEGADLRVPVVAVPDASNGFLLLSKGVEEVDWPEDRLPEGSDEDGETISVQDLAKGKIWDARFAAEVLTRHRDLLERFDRSLAMPGFQAPPPTAPGYSATHIQVWRPHTISSIHRAATSRASSPLSCKATSRHRA
ncbi:MAG TPA: hypothetical protein VMT52_07070 [Planctomycetota bacterium]|nr:hypothetical protein [Planctomycetota bacterium]